MTGQDPVTEPNPSKRAFRQLATWCATVVLAAVTAVAVTAAPAAADPPIGTPRTPNCVMICLTWKNVSDNPQVIAWSLYDVTYTPYWITIFNARTGYRITTCGTGTECGENLASDHWCAPTIAYIGSYTATMPPRVVVASTGVITNPVCSPAR